MRELLVNGGVGYIEDFIPKPAYYVFRKEEGALL